MNYFQIVIFVLLCFIALYIIFRLQAMAWLHTIDKFFTNHINKISNESKKI